MLAEPRIGYALQRVLDLALLALQLKIVGQMLPAAAAAHGEVLATRLHTHVACGHKALHAAYCVAAAFLFYLYVNDIAGSGEWHEHHHVVGRAAQRVAFCGHVAYDKPLDKGQSFSFSRHICINNVQRYGEKAERQNFGFRF